MVVKLLLLLLVIGAIYFTGRFHAVRRQRQLAASPLVLVQEPPMRREARWALYSGVGAVMLALAFYSVHAWEKSRELVRIRVININNGQNQLYETQRHLVGIRSFQTLDGRRVALADVERMEVEETVP